MYHILLYRLSVSVTGYDLHMQVPYLPYTLHMDQAYHSVCIHLPGRHGYANQAVGIDGIARLEGASPWGGVVICGMVLPTQGVWVTGVTTHHSAWSASQLSSMVLLWRFKGTVQGQLTGVESVINRQIILNCLVGRFPFFILKGHHHERSIKLSSASLQQLNQP